MEQNMIVTTGQEGKMARKYIDGRSKDEEVKCCTIKKRDECNETQEMVATLTINKPREPVEVNQEPLTEEAYQNLPSSCNAADYEQELYEKDRYIEGLENEIRGLKGLTHLLREKIL